MNAVASRLCLVGVALVLFGLAGCSTMDGVERKRRATSSVVDYLYPDKQVAVAPSIPHLSLPLRVGMAFVPDGTQEQNPWRSQESYRLNEKEKMDLMDRVAAEFKALPFVKEVEPIPSAYIREKGSFTNLDQIKLMHGIDVIVLLSYDQVQHTDDSILSLTYLSIVGAAVIRGEKNDTSTMIDAVVMDIASRKMLFRAPGTSQVKAVATPLHLQQELRANAIKGYQLAADNLVLNLKDQLERFKEKIKETPEEYKVEHKPGYTGGASMGGIYALFLLVLGSLALWRSRKN